MGSRAKSSRKLEEHKHHVSEKDSGVENDVPAHISYIDPAKDKQYQRACLTVTLIAAALRFTLIWFPSEVVFDEVHFGKFASYYLQHTYFFDLHPPFAKLLIALVAYLTGYDGHFKFNNIGDSYLSHSVPYIPLRCLSATLGTLTVPLVFNTMKESGYSVLTCCFSAILIALDNAHVTETRLILLDATLIFSVACSVYCYVRFTKQRRNPFSQNWYLWLALTGVSLSCVISTKYVGVFTYMTIGIAVIYELWQILDIKNDHSLRVVTKHVLTRLLFLVVIPFMIYLFWFYLHFALLTKSGPGDGFMSPEFQETLGDSVMAKEARDVYYHDIITLKHKDTECLLHSHNYHYPLRYDDGRVSSQGQQVTCMSDYNDTGNYWEILPVQDTGKAQLVKQGDTFRLKHINTKGYLLTHDVASPLYATNEEFTVIPEAELNKDNNANFTLFRFEPQNKRNGDAFKTKSSLVKIVHVPTVVAMWTHNDKLLPDWGFSQQEVNGNKEMAKDSNIWYADTIVNLPPERKVFIPKQVKKMPFIKKWVELQFKMFQQNNDLSSEHPYASEPLEWPMCVSGVSFWTKNDTKQQIFFVGNVPAWWLECICISSFLAVIAIDLVTRRRGVHILTKFARGRLYLNIGYFFEGWACHYFLFFLMDRQKFLHHYLPAHLIAAMLTGAMIEFLITDNRTHEFSGKKYTPGGKNRLCKYKYASVIAGLTAVVVWGFVFFAPMTYGNISLSPAEVQRRQWMHMKMHFAK